MDLHFKSIDVISDRIADRTVSHGVCDQLSNQSDRLQRIWRSDSVP